MVVRSMLTCAAVLLLFSTQGCWAHMALWHKSMYGLNGTAGKNPFNTGEPTIPLNGATFDKWWFHGFINQPPRPGDFFNIPAGGSVKVEIATNKAFTTLGQTQPTTDCPLGPGRCKDWSVINNQPYWDVMHTTGLPNVKGCAIAMVYESDPFKIKPEDFVVVSVQKQCVWKRQTAFSFPGQLRKCPSGGCHCLWSWVHSYEGGTGQVHQSFFKCQVSNPASPGRALGRPISAVDCAKNKAKCVRGAKQPMYWMFKERNNRFEPANNPPVYMPTFGFSNGAQNDAFDNGIAPRVNARAYPPSHHFRERAHELGVALHAIP